ncbi:endonuclease/exonuclease/phosphatase family protein [Microbulbifer bruguierae]|uniref:Endonuclease/exonuclease/phosphatase family protein n=1 Tax=Microbulbifer bruguierae TaxID=3029061 RepID=A0ABY8NL45_9GAMM|nr:endonuclease/exonuclease/phosphatase family protein [Microbulbifer bruguierae]WGL18333.1 endonuclease/exonuclease/phosphatase family protein [Microbulbifer bruguierae]
MPFYKPLKRFSEVDRKRTVAGLKRLREQFTKDQFPEKTASKSLILGTWNIRNFDDDRFNYGPRLQESLYYIAEIVSRFDVIAVQEICEDLWPLDELMNLLGRQYRYILTDVTHSGLGGNRERLGFIYDKNKVSFKGVAGELVLPDKMLISEVEEKKRQFSRTPFGVLFQSGWFEFIFSTVHIYFGNDSPNAPEYDRRVKEIEAVAKYLKKEAVSSNANQILVGDFNIKEPGSKGFNALEKNGFTTVKNKKGSNRDQTKFYDQISFLSRRNELVLMQPERDDQVFQFFDSVFRADDFQMYKPIIMTRIQKKLNKAEENLAAATSQSAKNKAEGQIARLSAVKTSDVLLEEYYEEWRTFQMSDHLPLWVELEIDFSDSYLDYLSTYEA